MSTAANIPAPPPAMFSLSGATPPPVPAPHAPQAQPQNNSTMEVEPLPNSGSGVIDRTPGGVSTPTPLPHVNEAANVPSKRPWTDRLALLGKQAVGIALPFSVYGAAHQAGQDLNAQVATDVHKEFQQSPTKIAGDAAGFLTGMLGTGEEAPEGWVRSESGTLFRMPVEKTTGVPESDAAIKAGGGIPSGVFKKAGDMQNDLHLISSPKTGSTFGLPANEVTPENVAAHMQISHDIYAKSRGAKPNPKPGEGAKAVGLLTEPPRVIPEQEVQSRSHLIQTMQNVLRNPHATEADKAAATQRINELTKSQN